MKKSKVIIPAMALLLFSTAASITGTVAWFTSTRTFTTSAGNFRVASLEGDLACVVADGTATTKNGNNITVDTDARLADASFNHLAASRHLFTDIPDTATFQDLGAWALDKYTVPSSWYYGQMGDLRYYYAATWKYTFTYTFKAEQSNMNLFFDVNNSTATYYKANGDAATTAPAEAADTALGFRLAFTSDYTMTSENDTHKQFVWAPFRAQSDVDPDGEADSGDEHKAIRYVSTTTAAPADYTTDLLDSGAKTDTTTYGLGEAGVVKADTLPNCIGVFKKPASEGDVTVTVNMTAWFEGTDPAIVTDEGKKFQQTSANLVFKVRKAA